MRKRRGSNILSVLLLWTTTACIRPTTFQLPTDGASVLIVLQRTNGYSVLASPSGQEPSAPSFSNVVAATTLVAPCALDDYGLLPGENPLALRADEALVTTPLPAGRRVPGLQSLPEVPDSILAQLDLVDVPARAPLDRISIGNGTYELPLPSAHYFASDGRTAIAVDSASVRSPHPMNTNQAAARFTPPTPTFPSGLTSIRGSSTEAPRFLALLRPELPAPTTLVSFSLSTPLPLLIVPASTDLGPDFPPESPPEFLFAGSSSENLLAAGPADDPRQTRVSIRQNGAWSTPTAIDLPFERHRFGAALFENRWLIAAPALGASMVLTATSAAPGSPLSNLTQAATNAYWAASPDLGVFRTERDRVVMTAGPSSIPDSMAGDGSSVVVAEGQTVRYYRASPACSPPTPWISEWPILAVGLTDQAVFVVVEEPTGGSVIWLNRR
jgi:hypothetical protein